MAVAFGSAGTYLAYGSRTDSTLVAPSGIANGDLLLAYLFVAQNVASPTVTPPAGWTALTGSPTSVNLSGFFGKYHIFWKIASSESGSYVFTHASASSCGLVIRYTGVDTASPFSPTPTTNTGATTTATATGFTTTVNNTFVVFTEHDWADSTTDTVVPAGTTPTFTERVDDVLLYIADGTLATAGATGNKSHTCNGSVASPWGAYLIGLKPAAAVTTDGVASASGNGTATGAGATAALRAVVYWLEFQSDATTAVTTDGVASASGTGAAAGVGAKIGAATAAAAGTGAALAVGAGIAAAVGATAGVGAGVGVGQTITAAVGAAASVGAASGVGAESAAASGAAAGIGAASGVGAKSAAASGVAAGIGAASGIGAKSAAASGAAAGIGAASGIGAYIQDAVASASGTSAATGVSAQGAAVGAASGIGAGVGVGQTITAAVGATAGVGAAAAIGQKTVAALGAAAGIGAAAGVSPALGTRAVVSWIEIESAEAAVSTGVQKDGDPDYWNLPWFHVEGENFTDRLRAQALAALEEAAESAEEDAPAKAKRAARKAAKELRAYARAEGALLSDSYVRELGNVAKQLNYTASQWDRSQLVEQVSNARMALLAYEAQQQDEEDALLALMLVA